MGNVITLDEDKDYQITVKGKKINIFVDTDGLAIISESLLSVSPTHYPRGMLIFPSPHAVLTDKEYIDTCVESKYIGRDSCSGAKEGWYSRDTRTKNKDWIGPYRNSIDSTKEAYRTYLRKELQ